MKLEHTGPVVANGPGATVYLGEQFLEHPSFPFDPGDDVFRALFAHDSEAIVLLPDEADLEYPLTLTIHDPEAYRLTIDTDETESTSKPMIEPHSDDANPGGGPR